MSSPSDRPPEADPTHPTTDSAPRSGPAHPSQPEGGTKDGAEALLARFLREAPRMPGARDLGLRSSVVKPWPHQQRVVREAARRYPHSFLFCDEVGLGKTIEAGSALRQLWISGRVGRALLLVPKAVLRQWQEELHEKLCLDVPRFEGGRFLDVRDRETPEQSTDANPWNRHPLILASTQLARSKHHHRALLAAEPWDLLIVDEAHHARRRRATDGGRPNRLLELLAGKGSSEPEAGLASPSGEIGSRAGGLVARSRCLYLLTATPMQVHPVEAWDLLRLLGMGGRWGGSEAAFLGYFEQLRRPPEERDWGLLGSLLRESLDASPSAARPSVGDDLADLVDRLCRGRLGHREVAKLDPERVDRLDAFLRRTTPVRRWVFRHTRDLLRRYRAAGLLDAPVPERRPENVWIEMTPPERALYGRIEDYLGRFYQRYEARRTGLGFVMTVYRRRLTSSFRAIRRSLERRRDLLAGTSDRPAASEGLVADDIEALGGGFEPSDPILARLGSGEQQSLFASESAPERQSDAESGRLPETLRFSEDEREFLDAFIDELGALPVDSKLERLRSGLAEILAETDRVLVFTQYTDTLDQLREALRDRYRVACYSGRGGEVPDPQAESGWVPSPKEGLKAAFGRGEIQVLLCTEAASEGLNFQTCGVLVNYDVPWNPMRVEQRIGRIDRIGQQNDRVRIYNYFYSDTVEAAVYERLSERIDGFREVIGELQPILRRVESTIESLAMTPASQRPKATRAGLHALDRDLSERPPSVVAFSEDLPSSTPSAAGQDTGETSGRGQRVDAPGIDPLDGSVASDDGSICPVDLEDVRSVLVGARALAGRLEPDAEVPGLYSLDGERRVTFDPALYDSRPYSVELITWGTALFDRLILEIESGGSIDGRGGGHGTADPSGIGLYRTRNPAPVSVFLAPTPAGIEPIRDLEGLRRSSIAPPRRWTADEEGRASTLFSRQRRRLLLGMEEVESRRRSAESRAIFAGAADILVRAAWIELVRAESPGLFDQPLPFGIGAESVAAQARHGEPFAALWRIASEGEGADGQLRTRPDDPWPDTLRGRSAAVLDRMWADLATRGADLVARRRVIEAAEEAKRAAERDPSASGLLDREYFVLGELEQPPWSPEILSHRDIRPFVDAVPIFDSLSAAVDRLLEAAEEGYDPDRLAKQRPEGFEWVAPGGWSAAGPGSFVAPVSGRALEPRWPEGSWVLFRIDPRPPRSGSPALFHHPDLADPETGESAIFRIFTIETIRTQRRREQRLFLSPTSDSMAVASTDSGLAPIEVDEPELLEILAVPVEVLGPDD